MLDGFVKTCCRNILNMSNDKHVYTSIRLYFQKRKYCFVVDMMNIKKQKNKKINHGNNQTKSTKIKKPFFFSSFKLYQFVASSNHQHSLHQMFVCCRDSDLFLLQFIILVLHSELHLDVTLETFSFVKEDKSAGCQKIKTSLVLRTLRSCGVPSSTVQFFGTAGTGRLFSQHTWCVSQLGSQLAQANSDHLISVPVMSSM